MSVSCETRPRIATEVEADQGVEETKRAVVAMIGTEEIEIEVVTEIEIVTEIVTVGMTEEIEVTEIVETKVTKVRNRGWEELELFS